MFFAASCWSAHQAFGRVVGAIVQAVALVVEKGQLSKAGVNRLAGVDQVQWSLTLLSSACFVQSLPLNQE